MVHPGRLGAMAAKKRYQTTKPDPSLAKQPSYDDDSASWETASLLSIGSKLTWLKQMKSKAQEKGESLLQGIGYKKGKPKAVTGELASEDIDVNVDATGSHSTEDGSNGAECSPADAMSSIRAMGFTDEQIANTMQFMETDDAEQILEMLLAAQSMATRDSTPSVASVTAPASLSDVQPSVSPTRQETSVQSAAPPIRRATQNSYWGDAPVVVEVNQFTGMSAVGSVDFEAAYDKWAYLHKPMPRAAMARILVDDRPAVLRVPEANVLAPSVEATVDSCACAAEDSGSVAAVDHESRTAEPVPHASSAAADSQTSGAISTSQAAPSADNLQSTESERFVETVNSDVPGISAVHAADSSAADLDTPNRDDNVSGPPASVVVDPEQIAMPPKWSLSAPRIRTSFAGA